MGAQPSSRSARRLLGAGARAALRGRSHARQGGDQDERRRRRGKRDPEGHGPIHRTLQRSRGTSRAGRICGRSSRSIRRGSRRGLGAIERPERPSDGPAARRPNTRVRGGRPARDGVPVVSCHGTPSCRFPGAWAEAAEAAGAYFHPARPSRLRTIRLQPRAEPARVGARRRRAGRRSWARSLCGASGPREGARTPLLAPMPSRIAWRPSGWSAASGRSGTSPRSTPARPKQSGAWIRELIDLARSDPEAAVAHAREECEQDAEMVERDPAEWLSYWFDNESVPSADRTLVTRPEDRGRMVATLREAVRSGTEGYVQDELILTVRPWGFGAEQIAVPAYLWHGELDTLAPVGGARYLARVIPGCRGAVLRRRGAPDLASPRRGDPAHAGRGEQRLTGRLSDEIPRDRELPGLREDPRVPLVRLEGIGDAEGV